MVRRKCQVCGDNWIVSENGDNICSRCQKTFGIKESKTVESKANWEGQKFYTTGQ